MSQLTEQIFSFRTLRDTGIVAAERPDRSLRALRALRQWGSTPAAGYVIQAVRSPHRVAIRDEIGEITFAEVNARTNAIARGLGAAGLGEGDRVAVLCRNHRGFIEGVVAASKIGADAVCLNTGFAGPQIAELCARESVSALIYDEEFSAAVADPAPSIPSFVAWSDDRPADGQATLDGLAAAGSRAPLKAPDTHGRVIILTSGTTGLPKGARREVPDGIGAFAPLFDRIPLRARRSTMIAAPLFHTWGFAHLAWSMSLGSTVVLRRRFDAEETLAVVARERVDTLVVVPVMLQRMLDLPAETIRRYDTASLRVVALSGSALPGELARRAMDAFGDVLYNLYGSTEVAWATVATPADLRSAPGTAGRPPRGTVVRIYDEDGIEVPHGQTGRIFVGNELQFEGYTGGGTKASIDGLMSSGDVGFLDREGRLFISGRDDEMIVSGGENVFPREVEDLLADHPDIQEAAVIGVEDADFGQRLVAFVVAGDGKALTQDEVQEHVRKNLARYKVPRDVTFVEELPRNPAGKVLKRELARSLSAQHP